MNTLANKIANRNKSAFELYPRFPSKNLLLELSNACNHRCIFCANRKMTRKIGFMNEQTISSALKQAFELGCREVGFYATGEPLINKNIYFAIRQAKSLGYSYCYLTTNGSLCNLGIAKELLECGLNSIKFSINAIDEKTYAFIHGRNDFNRVIKNLKEIYEFRAKNKLKFKLYVSYIATKYSNYKSSEISGFFHDICDDVLIVNARNQSGLTPETITLLGNMQDTDKIQANRMLPCHYAFNAITISYEGYVTACCTDYQNYLAYGNINTTPLKEIWHNKIITELRKQHLQQKLKNNLCNNCIFNSKKTPRPLNKKYATKFRGKTMFDCNEVEKRIEEFCREPT